MNASYLAEIPEIRSIDAHFISGFHHKNVWKISQYYYTGGYLRIAIHEIRIVIYTL